ncbi:MAG: hypothetical protein O9972_55625 [Burkholderiales bacterium]|nr:hypothetical protein [Burkholderiales bacterium]
MPQCRSAIGPRTARVDTFPTRLGAGLGERPPEPGITTLHTHPTSDGPQRSGFSLGDVSCVLSTGTSLAVYDKSVAMRIRPDDSSEHCPSCSR